MHRATLLLALVCALEAAAQQAPAPPPEPARLPDVAITATVRIREMQFETVPNVTVTFAGGADHVNVWETQRVNLPEKVEPRVIYRDVGIILKITSTLPDIEIIVDEALAEVRARRSAQ